MEIVQKKEKQSIGSKLIEKLGEDTHQSQQKSLLERLANKIKIEDFLVKRIHSLDQLLKILNVCDAFAFIATVITTVITVVVMIVPIQTILPSSVLLSLCQLLLLSFTGLLFTVRFNVQSRMKQYNNKQRIENPDVIASRQERAIKRFLRLAAIQFTNIFATPLLFLVFPIVLAQANLAWLTVPYSSSFTEELAESVLLTPFLERFLLLAPLYLVVAIAYSLVLRQIWYNEKTAKLFFEKWKYRTENLAVFNLLEPILTNQELFLGYRRESGEPIRQQAVSRRVNNCYFGPIGCGKGQAAFLPMIYQDLENFIDYLYAFHQKGKEESWYHEDVSGTYLNAMFIVEPTNSLCATVYRDAVRRGVPEDCILYFNPLTPETPSMNALSGDVEQVTANITNSIADVVSPNLESFYSKKIRSHLSATVRLLKYSNRYELAHGLVEEEVGMFDLCRCYEDNMQLWRRYQLLIELCKEEERYVMETRERYNKGEISYEKFQDEKADFDSLIQTMNFWKRALSHEAVVERIGSGKNAHNEYKILRKADGSPLLDKEGKEQIVYEVKDRAAGNERESFIEALTDFLGRMSQNKYFRRMFFGKDPINFETLMRVGKIVLVNTCDELDEALAETTGLLVTSTIQAAVMRKDSLTRDPACVLYYDEFGDLVKPSFSPFVAKSRKKNCFTNVACQSMGRVEDRIGHGLFLNFMTNFRNKMFFGDANEEEAKKIEAMSGTAMKVDEMQVIDRERFTDDKENKNDNVRLMFDKNAARITATEIMELPKWHILARMMMDGDTEAGIVIRCKPYFEMKKENKNKYGVDVLPCFDLGYNLTTVEQESINKIEEFPHQELKEAEEISSVQQYNRQVLETFQQAHKQMEEDLRVPEHTFEFERSPLPEAVEDGTPIHTLIDELYKVRVGSENTEIAFTLPSREEETLPWKRNEKKDAFGLPINFQAKREESPFTKFEKNEEKEALFDERDIELDAFGMEILPEEEPHISNTPPPTNSMPQQMKMDELFDSMIDEDF